LEGVLLTQIRYPCVHRSFPFVVLLVRSVEKASYR
jgi:hypothetical protein